MSTNDVRPAAGGRDTTSIVTDNSDLDQQHRHLRLAQIWTARITEPASHIADALAQTLRHQTAAFVLTLPAEAHELVFQDPEEAVLGNVNDYGSHTLKLDRVVDVAGNDLRVPNCHEIAVEFHGFDPINPFHWAQLFLEHPSLPEEPLRLQVAKVRAWAVNHQTLPAPGER